MVQVRDDGADTRGVSSRRRRSVQEPGEGDAQARRAPGGFAWEHVRRDKEQRHL